MEPLLFEDDFVLVSALFLRLKVGDLVAANHLDYGIIIKRIVAIGTHGLLQLRGQNPTSLTTEQIGDVHRSQLIGKVIFSIAKNN